MEDFSIGEMQQMQKALQEKYRHKWEPICPDVGKSELLWMIGEIGEVIDIVKKHGGENAAANEDVRVQLVEERPTSSCTTTTFCSAMGSARELKRAYTEKFEKNMTRW